MTKCTIKLIQSIEKYVKYDSQANVKKVSDRSWIICLCHQISW